MQKTEENMKKKTDDLVNEIISSKTMNHYLNTNQEEFLEIPLHVYLKHYPVRFEPKPYRAGYQWYFRWISGTLLVVEW